MALDENFDLVRNLQKTGAHLARLTGYMAIGVQPSHKNLLDAQRWFQAASADVEPMLQAIEADKASSRVRQAFRG